MIKTLKALAFVALYLMFYLVQAEEVMQIEEELQLPSQVLELTDNTFDEAIAKHDYLLVQFYAPWCSYCKEMEPEYDAAAAALAAQDPPLTIARIDATVNRGTTDRLGIKTFPALFFYNKGQKIDYKGDRTKEAIIKQVNRKYAPLSLEVDCTTMVEKKDKGELALFYIGDLKDDLYDVFMKGALNAELNDIYAFYYTSDTKCASNFGTSGDSIVLVRDFDKSPLLFNAYEDDIIDFGLAATVPSLINFSEEYIKPIFVDKKPAIMLFTEDEEYPYQDVFAQAAKELSRQILFYTSGQKEGPQTRLAEYIGIKDTMRPAILILEPQGIKMYKYAFPGDECNTSVADIKIFVNDYIKGKLKPYIKSEEIPEQQTVGGLTTIVGKTWDKIVNEPDKDVFVLYYSKSCWRSDFFEDTLFHLAKTVEDIENLVIAKFDVNENEVEGLQINSFPTFILHTPAKNYEHSLRRLYFNSARRVIDLVDKYGDTKYALEHNGRRDQVQVLHVWFQSVSEVFQEATKMPMDSRTLNQKLKDDYFGSKNYDEQFAKTTHTTSGLTDTAWG